MTQTKKYAICCSYEEEARECNENGHGSIICVGDSDRDVYLYTHKIDNARTEGYTIISYKEAKEMGLLGEKTTVKDEIIKKKLLGYDEEDGIRCEIRGYWKDGICYVKDVINKRIECAIQKSLNNDKLIEKIMEDINQPICMPPGSTISKEIRKILTKHLSSK